LNPQLRLQKDYYQALAYLSRADAELPLMKDGMALGLKAPAREVAIVK
jgi:hypothetical protein